MTKQLIKLTPLAPYFFGGERIFEKGDNNKYYFIRSLELPSQTALFGVLRYLAIDKPGSMREWNKKYSEKRRNNDNTNEFRGYALNRPDVSFGNIAGISPLYLVDAKNCFYAPLPFDHIKTVKEENNGNESKSLSEPVVHKEVKVNNEYTPFSDYHEVNTTVGMRSVPIDYNAKDGIVTGWLALDGSRRIKTELFESVTQIGIDRVLSKHAFYKKEYIRLKQGYSFAFFADIEMPLYNHLVYIGQDKTPFHVEWEEVESEPEFPAEYLRNGMAYAQSDIYIQNDVSELYNLCSFVNVKLRTHRLFKESYLDRSGSTTTKLISAGSVFMPNNIEKFIELTKNKHAEIAGFNRIIIGIGGAKK